MLAQNFIDKINLKKAKIAIMGLGYVGLPLARAFCAQGIQVTGFDVDTEKVDFLNAGKSYIKHIPDKLISEMRNTNIFNATNDFSFLSEADAIIICVPTPLSKHREPDLGPVLSTARSILKYLRKGQLVVLESSTYPGTTDEELACLLEQSGMKTNEDFFLAYSPEREDPGNKDFDTSSIPKIVGADTEVSRSMALALYQSIIAKVIPVASSRTAEAIKLTENIFRSVNIALVNELKVIFDAMEIDIWDVIKGASSKPFGYMPFYPGPGLGGHCIPIDPFYLTYKAREFNVPTRFVELAGEINTNMPRLVVSKVAGALSLYFEKSLKGSKILIIGMSYKKNVDDMRESPSLVLTEFLEVLGAKVDYHDEFVPRIPRTREHGALEGRESILLTPETLTNYDAILISTDHDYVDYQMIADSASLVIDTRNALGGISSSATVVKA